MRRSSTPAQSASASLLLRSTTTTTTQAATTTPRATATRRGAGITLCSAIIVKCIIFICLHLIACTSASAATGTAAAPTRRRIDFVRVPAIRHNGIEIHEHTLLDHLHEHEKLLLFGKKAHAKRSIKLVHLRQQQPQQQIAADTATATATAKAHAAPTYNNHNSAHYKRHDDDNGNDNDDVGVDDSDDGNVGVGVAGIDGISTADFVAATHAHVPLLQRNKRNVNANNNNNHNKRNHNNSSNNNDNDNNKANAEQQNAATAAATSDVDVRIEDDEQLLHMRLRPTTKLIDDAFVFIRRYTNSTQFIENSHKLAERYERCFYSNENSALDLCDEENVRGVFRHNATDFIIHPLPARFGNASHIIIESNKYNNTPTTSSMPPKVAIKSTPPSTATTNSVEDDFDMNLQFEPDEDEFNEPNIMKLATTEADTLDIVTRATRNIAHATHAQHVANQSHYHVPLHLRYKPQHRNDRSHQLNSNTHHQHHHHHHRKSRNHTRNKHSNSNRQHHKSHTHQQHTKANRNGRPADGESVRQRRHISSSGSQWKIPQVLHIETAIFVDSDLFNHMAKYFPEATEAHLMRFVLAMINGVQLLYQHPSLGHRINFVLKRLEILHNDPLDLRRSNDIDTYLSNFCIWQKSLNPSSDTDALHYDHAVILTGLDLYVLGKNGKEIRQVVGLAPVAGMCTLTSSCTINEGKHFESVFVVAHEIGHNLGMRHDTNEINCDPSLHIMSPTLGSGKITWSKCSRSYLNDFLTTTQAACLFNRGQIINTLDHSAEGLLPGERFDANQQCMLKYGINSTQSSRQTLSDICRDLHCQKERYTWTSHPALEGSKCGDNMWCRSGICVMRPTQPESSVTSKQAYTAGKPDYDKSSFIESSKMGHLLHEYNSNKLSSWGEWGEASSCDSGCLYGPSKRLREGSTGLKTYSRTCLDYRRRCIGLDRKYESCIAKQCYSIAIITITDFATQVCERAQKFDSELTGEGQQKVGGIEESCKVYCKTKSNGTKSRSWTFPDGTTCRSKLYKSDDIAYCITGRCEKFSCDNSTKNYYKIDSKFCNYRPSETLDAESRRTSTYKSVPATYNQYTMNNRVDNNHNSRDNRIYGPTPVPNKYENEVLRSYHSQQPQPQQQQSSISAFRRKMDSYASYPYQNYNAHMKEQQQSPQQQQFTSQPRPAPVAASLVALNDMESSEWVVKSGCHSSCMAKSKGIQVVTSKRTGANNIQLCTHAVKPCERLLTPTDYAENTCARYRYKVRGLSGHGTQIAASIDEPDRSCRVGCQDEFIQYRFYLVNGKYGHFPLGTRCSHTEERYCVNGKCLRFGSDNIPLEQSQISLALFRNRRATTDEQLNTEAADLRKMQERKKRSYLYYDPVNITETLTQEFINNIVNSIINYEQRQLHKLDADLLSVDHIEFTNPIHITTSDNMHTN